jgi:hypothetical protein
MGPEYWDEVCENGLVGSILERLEQANGGACFIERDDWLTDAGEPFPFAGLAAPSHHFAAHLLATRVFTQILTADGDREEMRTRLVPLFPGEEDHHPGGENAPGMAFFNWKKRIAVEAARARLAAAAAEVVTAPSATAPSAPPAAATQPSGEATAAPPVSGGASAEVVAEMLAVLGDENGARVLAVAQDRSMTVDQRQRLIYQLDNRAVGFTSRQWARLLSTTHQAASQTDWWTVDRQRLRADS